MWYLWLFIAPNATHMEIDFRAFCFVSAISEDRHEVRLMNAMPMYVWSPLKLSIYRRGISPNRDFMAGQIVKLRSFCQYIFPKNVSNL